jgi:hypothetical protein
VNRKKIKKAVVAKPAAYGVRQNKAYIGVALEKALKAEVVAISSLIIYILEMMRFLRRTNGFSPIRYFI